MDSFKGIPLGENSPLRKTDAPKARRGAPEDEHMRYQCIPRWAEAGFQAYVTSSRRHAKGVTPGMADLILFSPFLGIEVAHEVKLPGDRQSQGQLAYQEHCRATCKAYVLGDVVSAEDFLVWLGVGFRELRGMIGHGTVYRVRRQSEYMHMAGSYYNGWTDRRRAIVGHWHETPLAKAHQERYGWKPTPGALRKLARSVR
jgi:hypothetical protein